MPEEPKPVKEEKKSEKKEGKKPKSKSKHNFVKIWEHYKAGKFSSKWCPRCGPGTILGQHKDRVCCGKCRYSEIQKNKSI